MIDLRQVRAALDRYLVEFNAGAFATAAERLHFPLLFIGYDGVSVFQTADDYVAALSALHTRLKAEGFARSVFIECGIAALDAHVAIASVIFERRRADDSVLQRGAGLYTLYRRDDHWVIAMFAPSTEEVVRRLM